MFVPFFSFFFILSNAFSFFLRLFSSLSFCRWAAVTGLGLSSTSVDESCQKNIQNKKIKKNQNAFHIYIPIHNLLILSHTVESLEFKAAQL